jgi:hypothetical protein
MKIVRRDHNISPIDRSNTRRLEARNPGAGGSGRELVGWVIEGDPRHVRANFSQEIRSSGVQETKSQSLEEFSPDLLISGGCR